MLLRTSLRHERPALLVPAFGVAVAVYAWLPDPWSAGADSLRHRLVPWLATLTGGSEWATWSLWFAPCAALFVVAYGFLVQRERTVHARVVAAIAAPAGLAVAAGLLLSSLHHASLGVALAGLGAASCWCGQLARRTLPVAFGSVGLLVGVGAAGAALQLPHVAIGLALALAVIASVVTHAFLARGASHFAQACARRWVDGATLFGLVAIPVAWSVASLRYPHDVVTAANELALALLAFVLARAWRRPEPAIVAGLLVGRAGVGLLELGGRNVAALQGLQIVAAIAALPALMTFALACVPLERRLLPRPPSSVVAGVLAVLTIQGVACVRYGRSLVGIGQDVPQHVITSLAVLLPLVAVVIAGRLANARADARREAPAASVAEAAEAAEAAEVAPTTN
jgi:cytochrome c-type biogenesis protein CcmH/NrfF